MACNPADAGLPLLGVGGEVLAPLQLRYECCALPETVARNISRTLDSAYEPITRYLCEQNKGACSIVGSGPSLLRTWEHIQDIGGVVIACNAAHDFLIGRGLIPDFAMFWDADPVIASMFKPRKDVTYLVASRAHEEVFKKLRGHDVVVWHAAAYEEPIADMLSERGIDEPLVHGGSAAVTRSMYLAVAMGYHDVHTFGMDGSFHGEHTHVRKSAVEEKPLRVWCDGVWYDSSPWLCGQAEDFKLIAPILKSAGVGITVHGSGLIPHIARNMGFPVITHEEE